MIANVDLSKFEPVMRSAFVGLDLSSEDIEDAIQDTYLRVIGILDEGEIQIQDLKAFLWRAARWMGLNINTKNKKEREKLSRYFQELGVDMLGHTGSNRQEPESVEPMVPSSTVEEQTIAQDYTSKAMGSLTDQQQIAVQLVDVLGYTFQEGADLVGTSKQSFNRLYHRAKNSLERWRWAQQ
jgi:RNA polymerase sigma factor (sigma-70 family)